MKARTAESSHLMTTTFSIENLLPPVHNAQDVHRSGSKVTTRAPSASYVREGTGKARPWLCSHHSPRFWM